MDVPQEIHMFGSEVTSGNFELQDTTDGTTYVYHKISMEDGKPLLFTWNHLGEERTWKDKEIEILEGNEFTVVTVSTLLSSRDGTGFFLTLLLPKTNLAGNATGEDIIINTVGFVTMDTSNVVEQTKREGQTRVFKDIREFKGKTF
jgi:hypothetical protein